MRLRMRIAAVVANDFAQAAHVNGLTPSWTVRILDSMHPKRECVRALATFLQHQFVHFKMIKLGETFSTLLAVVRLFSVMKTFMRTEITRRSEALSAMRTLVWLLSCVSALMCAHCRKGRERFRTEGAFEPFDVLMNGTNMVVHCDIVC